MEVTQRKCIPIKAYGHRDQKKLAFRRPPALRLRLGFRLGAVAVDSVRGRPMRLSTRCRLRARSLPDLGLDLVSVTEKLVGHLARLCEEQLRVPFADVLDVVDVACRVDKQMNGAIFCRLNFHIPRGTMNIPPVDSTKLVLCTLNLTAPEMT